MIANFFQSLEHRKVEYLLISGQATVLYGAASFSEDIDLWLKPTDANRDAFLSVLRLNYARYYKLTPELTVENLVRGHGFHFVLPEPPGPGRETFLDVMGAPPRVGSFDPVVARAQWIASEWGSVHTIGIKDLVELKKTQRLEDYSIISKLVLAWFDQQGHVSTIEDFHWAIQNLFTLAELRMLLEEQPGARQSLPENAPVALKQFARQLLTADTVSETIEQEVSDWMQKRMASHQQADRHYWRDIIADLKNIRKSDNLMLEGTDV
jgi:hypothetical protein